MEPPARFADPYVPPDRRWVTLTDIRLCAVRAATITLCAWAVAGAIALLGLVVGATIESTKVLMGAVIATAPGLAIVLPSFVELAAARREPSPARDVAAFAAAFVGAMFGMALAATEITFALAMLEDRSFTTALETVIDTVAASSRVWVGVGLQLALFAAPCALICVGRLRGTSYGPTLSALAWNLLGVVVVVYPLTVFVGLLAASTRSGGGVPVEVFFWSCGAVIVCAMPGTAIALLYALADAIERRLAERLADRQ